MQLLIHSLQFLSINHRILRILYHRFYFTRFRFLYYVIYTPLIFTTFYLKLI